VRLAPFELVDKVECLRDELASILEVGGVRSKGGGGGGDGGGGLGDGGSGGGDGRAGSWGG